MVCCNEYIPEWGKPLFHSIWNLRTLNSCYSQASFPVIQMNYYYKVPRICFIHEHHLTALT